MIRDWPVTHLRRRMKSIFKSFNSTQPTPLVSLFAVATTILSAIFVYQWFFNAGVFDFAPMMIWLAVAIPAGIFGCIFLQVRSVQRNRDVAQQVHARIAEMEIQSKRAAVAATDSRGSSKPNLNRPLPEKDPFENL